MAEEDVEGVHQQAAQDNIPERTTEASGENEAFISTPPAYVSGDVWQRQDTAWKQCTIELKELQANYEEVIKSLDNCRTHRNEEHDSNKLMQKTLQEETYAKAHFQEKAKKMEDKVLELEEQLADSVARLNTAEQRVLELDTFENKKVKDEEHQERLMQTLQYRLQRAELNHKLEISPREAQILGFDDIVDEILKVNPGALPPLGSSGKPRLHLNPIQYILRFISTLVSYFFGVIMWLIKPILKLGGSPVKALRYRVYWFFEYITSINKWLRALDEHTYLEWIADVHNALHLGLVPEEEEYREDVPFRTVKAITADFCLLMFYVMVVMLPIMYYTRNSSNVRGRCCCRSTQAKYKKDDECNYPQDTSHNSRGMNLVSPEIDSYHHTGSACSRHTKNTFADDTLISEVPPTSGVTYISSEPKVSTPTRHRLTSAESSHDAEETEYNSGGALRMTHSFSDKRRHTMDERGSTSPFPLKRSNSNHSNGGPGSTSGNNGVNAIYNGYSDSPVKSGTRSDSPNLARKFSLGRGSQHVVRGPPSTSPLQKSSPGSPGFNPSTGENIIN